MSLRITRGIIRPDPVTFNLDGKPVAGVPGESIVAALIASGVRQLRRDSQGRPRGPYCNMGTCFECLLEVRTKGVDGCGSWRLVRGCLLPVTAGLELRSRASPPPDEEPL
jgi:D-hydroxyproline dehydrogenase subunit gamma